MRCATRSRSCSRRDSKNQKSPNALRAYFASLDLGDRPVARPLGLRARRGAERPLGDMVRHRRLVSAFAADLDSAPDHGRITHSRHRTAPGGHVRTSRREAIPGLNRHLLKPDTGPSYEPATMNGRGRAASSSTAQAVLDFVPVEQFVVQEERERGRDRSFALGRPGCAAWKPYAFLRSECSSADSR
jgi:hypothetical protein